MGPIHQLTPAEVHSAHAGLEERKRLDAALAEVAAAVGPLAAYQERWRRGRRCVAWELLVDWIVTSRKHRPQGEGWAPWVDVADDIAKLVDVDGGEFVEKLIDHVGDIKADGPLNGAASVLASVTGASKSTLHRDRKEIGEAIGVFRCEAEAHVSELTAEALRLGRSAIEIRLVSPNADPRHLAEA